MASRKTVYLPDDVEGLLADAQGLSSRIANIVRRWDWITRANVPSHLRRAQWLAICHANSGADDVFDAQTGTMGTTMLWANVADTRGLADQWDVDQDDLVRTLRAMSDIELLAVAEVVRRFWLATDLPTDEALERSGAAAMDGFSAPDPD